VPHVSKKPRLQRQCRGESVRRNKQLPLAAGENEVRELRIDLVESAIGTPVNSSILARRQALVKNVVEKAPSSIGNVVHACIVIDVRE
jgi:hypothetical protein